MRASVMRLLIGFLVCVLVTPYSSTVYSQAAGVSISQNVPEGVAFQVLAEPGSQTFRFHTDALRLDRYTIDCGQATGKLFGMEQLTFVEYGSVDAYDWDSGAHIATLTAGESLGPLGNESSFFLASASGHRASVYRFSHGGAGHPGDEVASHTFETTDCGSGVTSRMPAASAAIDVLFASDLASGTSFGGDYVVYAGVLTVQPGAALGWVAQDQGPAYVANGAGVIVPLVGGFGSGVVGMSGIINPEVRPGEVLPFVAQDQVALENRGSAPTISYVFGVVQVGMPVFQALHR